MKKRSAFTLIELLVVISIIAILMSILMPSLAKVRMQAKQTICLTGLKQCAVGAMAYEVDYGRLPTHAWEVSRNAMGLSTALPKQVTVPTTAGNYDIRELYSTYVSMNYFKCPLLPKWERDIDDIEIGTDMYLYTDYIICGGYWANLEKGKSWKSLTGPNFNKSNAFTKTSQTWSYEGHQFNVLFGDALWRAYRYSQFRTNHPTGEGNLSIFKLEPSDRQGWVETFYRQDGVTDDIVEKHLSSVKNGYVYTDGSAELLDGDDDKMVEMYHRRDNDYSFYIPHK
ncbi:MAG: type II secretion system protein [Sedimentisphaeraceae bacterium JB056]